MLWPTKGLEIYIAGLKELRPLYQDPRCSIPVYHNCHKTICFCRGFFVVKSTEWGWRLGGQRAGGVREEEEELERWGE